VIGIKNGKTGLCSDTPEVVTLTPDALPLGVEMLAGSYLGSDYRNDKLVQEKLAAGEMKYAAVTSDLDVIDFEPAFLASVKKLELDALIATGGDESLWLYSNLCKTANIPFIGVPKTIDNDVPMTDYALGFHSAVDRCTEMLDSLRTTARSHHMYMVLEVMGHGIGDLALYSGIDGGADLILMPEFKYSKEGVQAKVKSVREVQKRNFGLIVLSEKLEVQEPEKYSSAGDEVRAWLKEIGQDARVNEGGYMQRGGKVVPFDRMMGAAMGSAAIDLIAEGHTDKMLIWKNREITSVGLDAVKEGKKKQLHADLPIIRTAKKMNIYIGD
jgi:6-phosphofructokinase 1